jgi:hypothetical protein
MKTEEKLRKVQHTRRPTAEGLEEGEVGKEILLFFAS